MAKNSLSRLLGKKKPTPEERRQRRDAHPWRSTPTVPKKEDDRELAELREAERTHEAVTGSNRRGGDRAAGKLRRRRLCPTS